VELFYLAFLFISGVLLLLMAGLIPGQQAWERAMNALIGAGFIGYGIYLLFFFTGGTIVILFKVFIVPIAAIIYAVKGWKERRAAKEREQSLVQSTLDASVR